MCILRFAAGKLPMLKHKKAKRWCAAFLIF